MMLAPVTLRAWAASVLSLVAYSVTTASAAATNLRVEANGGVGPGNMVRDPNPQLLLSVDIDAPVMAALSITGPDGRTHASAPIACEVHAPGSTRSILLENYLGDGAYKIALSTYYAGDGVRRCTPDRHRETLDTQIAMRAATPLGVPQGPVLTREPGTERRVVWDFPVAYAPGAGHGHDVVFGRALALSAGGSAGGVEGHAAQVPALGAARIAFPAPGRYEVAARSKGRTTLVPSGIAPSPWSTVGVDVKAPFDLHRVRVAARRGRSYRIAGKVREPSARGRVRVALARGVKRGRFRDVGWARIRKGRIVVRVRARRSGTHRLRYRFGGSRTVAAGQWISRVKLRR